MTMAASNVGSPQEETFTSDTDRMVADTNTEVDTSLPEKLTLKTNFSYPRLSRHESNESRSSNGSVPWLTDASDSDISFEDDSIYNTSAGELWDSFWPERTSAATCGQSQEHYTSPHKSALHDDYLNVSPTTCLPPAGLDVDTTKIATSEPVPKVEEPTTLGGTLKPPTSQPTPRKPPVSYSVYPKLPVGSLPRHLHPPRTSSLGFEPPSPPERPLILRGSRSSTGLKARKSARNINSLFIAPSLPLPNKAASPQQQSAAKATVSVPVSPAYPPPPPPKMLRPSTSAFNLRDKTRLHRGNKGPAARDAAVPLVPLLPSALPEPSPAQSAAEPFVSVFELDSDSESEADDEWNRFAKRIARGLHKKGASEKRGAAERKAVAAGLRATDTGASDKAPGESSRNSGSISRKRGGSLGLILGLMGR
ncbi:hypothetical protein F4802DRAFT_486136 [Xylaria palmicola]|nr:hypothetical protein F4802DRAFT_486136 [Xylaria palmicola]